jgi:hypothetical protein
MVCMGNNIFQAVPTPWISAYKCGKQNMCLDFPSPDPALGFFSVPLSLDPTKAKTRSCMIQCNPKYEKRQKTKRKKTEKYFSAAFKKFI